jgi:hypothetical protein
MALPFSISSWRSMNRTPIGRARLRRALTCPVARDSRARRSLALPKAAKGSRSQRVVAWPRPLPVNVRREVVAFALRLAMCSRALAFLLICLAPLLGQSAPAFAWEEGDGFRSAALPVPTTGKTGFKRLTPEETGITFVNRISDERSIANRNLLSGSGVAAGDIDGDGWCDLFFCQLGGPGALYRNLGNWKFEDLTAQAGVACPGLDGTGAVFADIDGDGYLDLLVNTLGSGVHVFRNDGRGHFKEITAEAGVASKNGGMSLALADVDGNGTLDLYVVNYQTTTMLDQPTTTFQITVVNGKPTVTHVNGVPATSPELTNRFVLSPSGEVLELGQPDLLYLNDGQGHFSPVSWTSGAFLDEDGNPLTEAPRDWGLSVQMRDLNEDGAPDIYVCNDLYSPDRIWINDGKGHFRALARLALRSTSTFSMGIDFADLNRDGHVDFMVVDMLATNHKDRHTQVSPSRPTSAPIGLIDNRPQVWRNTLQVNRGDTTFAEIAFYAGVEASNWSWMPLFLDVDLDGYEDILIPNGQMRDFQNVDMQNRIDAVRAGKQLTAADIVRLVKMFPDFSTPSVAFRNRGDLTFEEVGAAWGFNSVGISQGTTLADLDNDGDLDVIVNKLNEPAGVYRNESVAPRVAVRLKGRPPNTQGIGAKLVVYGGPVTQSQEVICGGHYLSGADPMRVFAAGSLTNELKIEVTWRSGKQSVVTGVKPNRVCEIDEAAAQPAAPKPKPDVKPLFEDVSHLLNHSHHEDPFDDFERQPLLPNRLSQLGPGVAWHDLEGDGWEDLVVGSGKGGQMGVYRNDGHGGFAPRPETMFKRPVARDQTTIVGLGSTLLVGSANYEDGLTNGGWVRIFDLQRKASGESVLGQSSSAGPLAMGDIDGDGVLELFIGGRCNPGRYPEPATSLLLRNEGGRFVPIQRWEKLGLVSGAVFSDLNGDGLPELILACEWGPIRVFRNEKGKLNEVTKELGLADYIGWWNGVTTGDFDGDGRLDIIGSNWGLNNKYRVLSRQHPRHIYYGDFNGDGTVNLIESYFNEKLGKEVPERGYIAVKAAMPFIQEKVPTFEAYGTSSLEEIYGDRLKGAGLVEVNTLASMLFLNRGDHFEAVPLPAEAQLTPAFGICVGDLDGDGNEDVFLSQNFYATSPDTTRNDAGRGLWLRGDGKGGLKPVPGQESGVKVYGEQRGCALCDYDHDGRVDLAVTQNGNATKLYHNVGARRGLRVRLIGPPGNPNGVGATIRLKFGERFGPAREIHAGSGYWSQDSPVQVMATPEPPTQIWVRWPGGSVTTNDLPKGALEIKITQTTE